MKRKATFLLAMAAGYMAVAQTNVTFENFEDWTTVGGKDSATGWSSSNSVVMYPVKSLYKETDFFQGNFAAKVVTAPFGFVQYTTIGMLVNGQADFTYGGGGGGANVEYAGGGGTPVNMKPSELRGFFKYETNSASDQGTAQVLLTRYNTTTNQRDTVSYSTHTFGSQNAYTAFTIPLTDLMPGVMPDSITTIFSSSNPGTVAPNSVFSSLFLDSLTLFRAATPPVAAFTANATTGTVNTTQITFTDESTNTPTAWDWTFTPNTVAYQSGTTAASTNPIVKFTAAGNYDVKLTVTNADGSNSVTKTAYIQITTGTGTGIGKTELMESTSLYPNPAKDKVYLDKSLLGASLNITDVYGKQLIHVAKISTTELDVTALADGMYFIGISKEGQTRSGKLLIRK